MPFWSLFGKSKDSGDVVKPTLNTAESETYKVAKSGEAATAEERAMLPRLMTSTKEQQEVMQATDARVLHMDVENIDALVQRYQSEFRTADEAMKKRKANKGILNLYDYDNDKRYELWKEERTEMRKRLSIHPIDEFMDRPMVSLVLLLRLNTAVGVLYALGRTGYLYRTMDKVYAKLNGVSLGKIAFNEFTTNVAKGGFVSAVGTAGILLGDAVGKCGTLLYTQQVTVPDRTWWHVWCSGTFAGLFMGGALAACEYKALTRWGMAMLAGGLALPVSLASLYAGYCVYRPFAKNREHHLYDTYWRPWQERRLNPGGPLTMRGRYM